jgi:SAM-dependent methyltransferase
MRNNTVLKGNKNTDSLAGFCPVCSYDTPVKFRRVDGFDIYKCGRCRLLWVPNVNEEKMRGLYGAEYFMSRHKDIGYCNYLGDEEILRLNARHILASLPKSKESHPKILDIGCAYGFLLDEAKKLGWEPEGVELSEEAARYALNRLRLKVSGGSIFQKKFPDNSFDYITMVGVIEHLHDPIAAIRQAQRILKPSGYLVITTIDTNGLVRLFKLKPPEHLYYFSAQNLSILLHSCGFDVIKIAPFWYYYHVSEGLCRAFRLIFRFAERIEKYLEPLPFLKMHIRFLTNEMFVLSRKK